MGKASNMRKKNSVNSRRYRMYTVCCTLMFALLLAFHVHAEQSEELKKLDVLKQNIEQLKAELKATQGARNDVLKALEDSEKDIGNLSEKAKQLEQQREKEQKKLKDLNQERRQLKQKKK